MFRLTFDGGQALNAADFATNGVLRVERGTRGLTVSAVRPEAGLKGMWESMPVQVLKELVRRGKVPGELKTCSGRVFRLLRPLCMELPFKLSLHEKLTHML